MHKLRVMIADDERPARELLRSVLLEFEEVEVVGVAASGAEAVELIRELKPDLALLDMNMPEVSGLDVARNLRKAELPLIAFVTAYDDFAVLAFDANALDYLLKPVEKHRLGETLARARERLESQTVSVPFEAGNELLTHIPAKVRDEIFLIRVEDVVSILADGELLHIRTVGGRSFAINHRLKDLEVRLDERRFVRLSRGAIVNLAYIERIAPLPGGTYSVMMSDRQEITSSRQQSRILRSRLLKL